MTRVLVFDGVKAAKRFELCRFAVLSAGDGKGERTRETLRKEARLLDALDSVSTPDVTKPLDADVRVLVPEDPGRSAVVPHVGEGSTVHARESVVVSVRQITLDQDAFLLLEKYLDTCPWLPRAARDVVDVQDWVSAAEKIE